jgi:hypothetical protein
MLSAYIMASQLIVSLIAAVEVKNDYAEAYAEAQSNSKMLIVNVGTTYDLASTSDRYSKDFVFCQVDKDAKVQIEGKEVSLSSHPSFSDLDGAGIAIIDFKHEAHKGQVVSALPRRHMSASQVQTLFDLPEGTLTQRTLVWAMRVHPEAPQSTSGSAAPELMAHAENHSRVQANSNHQHHNLPLGIASSEIVAESWPWNHNVVDAAIDIVGSWRQSSGHWSAARSAWSSYGYDMKTNGSKWFATGVFR